jgi:hypothetical protein
MRIHVPSETIFNTAKQAYEKGIWSYRKQSGGKAEPRATIVWTDWDIHPYEVISFDSATHKRTNVLEENDGVYSYGVVELTVEELGVRERDQLDSDLQQATISSAILITEVFTLLYNDGVLNVPELSDKAKEEFAALTALVGQYTP